MKAFVRIAVAVLAAAVIGSGTLAQEKVHLKRVFKVGAVRKNTMEASISTPGATAEPITFNAESEDKVVKVTKEGNGQVESKQTSVKVNGTEVPGAGAAVETSTFTPQDLLVAFETTGPDADFSKRLGQALNPYLSDKEVGAGDTWVREFNPDKDKGFRGGTATEKLVAFETIGGVKTAKLTHSYVEKPFKDDKDPINVTATFWLDVTNGEIVKSDGSATGLPNMVTPGGAPMKMTFKMEFVPPKKDQ